MTVMAAAAAHPQSGNRSGTGSRPPSPRQSLRRDQTDPVVFEGEHGTAGGKCVDLTRGSTGAKELHDLLNSATRLRRINSEARGWVAGPYDFWESFTVAQVSPSLGTEFGALRLPMRAARSRAGLSLRSNGAPGVPPEFDARKAWPSCSSIAAIRNQGMCGSCWAFAASAVLADRFCVAVSNQEKLVDELADQGNVTLMSSLVQERVMHSLTLAPEHMVDCDNSNHGCQGGRLDDAWWYLRSVGVPSEFCLPYQHCPTPTDRKCGAKKSPSAPQSVSVAVGEEAPRGQEATCRKQCASGLDMKLYRAIDAYAAARPGDVPALQTELFQHGPVEVAFYVFSDFHNYREGVYSRTPGAYGPLGGHAVRLLGWGTTSDGDKDLDYWILANSWSKQWGMGGFFHMRRGTNECGIESTPAAGLPDVKAAVLGRV